MKNQTSLLLSLATTLGIFCTYLGQEPDTHKAPVVPVVPVVELVEVVTPLENARRASVGIVLKKYHSAGSATLIGRKKLDDGLYGYTGITAQHVVEDMVTAISKKPDEANRDMMLMVQPNFHGKATRIDVIISIPWSIPDKDWALFTFETKHKLACAPVANKTKFEAILPYENVYIVGCGGAYSQFSRKGQIGSMNNEHMDTKGQATSEYPWNRYPHSYFRMNTNVWYGDSGGSIFNKDGELIGLINAFSIMDWGSPVTHAGVAFKTHAALDLVGSDTDYFLIEDMER